MDIILIGKLKKNIPVKNIPVIVNLVMEEKMQETNFQMAIC